MSESREAQGTASVAQPPANDGVTAGMLLRRAREAAGLHVGALAVALKIPVRKLEALEENRWDLLTDAVFVRALASSVCRTLKIDPQPVLERLPEPATPRLLKDEDGIGTPYRAPSDGSPPGWLDHVTKPVFLAVFALLLGALVLILLPSAPIESKIAATGPAETPSRATQAVLPAAAVSPGVVENTLSTPATIIREVPPPASAADTPVTIPNPTVAASSVASAPASGIVMFRSKGPSWVEVKDAKGAVAMRKLLEAGEWAGASGALPLQVTVGRVDQTEVQVRGKPFDLGPLAKDNVARFEIK